MKRGLVIVGAVLGGVVVLVLIGGAIMPRADSKSAATQFDWTVIAHQGGNHLRPDNTMRAFRHAVELGVDALEMDVHATRDGTLVVIHDETVDRTTNGNGRVVDLSLEEIRELDAAYNWPHHLETTERPYRGQGITIPTLEEVLREFPDMPMTIEIKQASPSIVEPFGRLLQQYDREQNTVVASFHADVMREFRALFPEFATSGVQPEIMTFFILKTLLMGQLYPPPMEAFQVPERFGALRVITPRFVRSAQRRGLQVHVWTVNDSESMERILAHGVDGIITDRPDLLLEAVGLR